jgi:hypothetical protein
LFGRDSDREEVDLEKEEEEEEEEEGGRLMRKRILRRARGRARGMTDPRVMIDGVFVFLFLLEFIRCVEVSSMVGRLEDRRL